MSKILNNEDMKELSGNDDAGYFDRILSEIAIAYINQRIAADPSSQVRIVEIGTTGAGSRIKPKLTLYSKHIKEYIETDASDFQCIEKGGYDIAITADTLYIDRDVSNVLHNVKAVLQKNGLILLNELINNSISGLPPFSPEVWCELLESEGFRSVFFPAREACSLGRQIIVAESDGIIIEKSKNISENIIIEEKPKNYLSKDDSNVKSEQMIIPETINSDVLKEKSEEYIKKLVGEALKIPSSRIDSSDPLEAYGVDSILAIQITNSLQEVFSNINNTLLFEHQTVSALAEYFIRTQKDSLMRALGFEKQKEPIKNTVQKAIPEAVKVNNDTDNGIKGRFTEAYYDKDEVKPEQDQDIAVIGLCGRYPKAGDIDKLWDNLQQGRDCIEEVPKERWDHSLFFDEDKQKYGKCYSKWGGFLEEVQYFDPLFFNISPKEAEIIDPQQRLFLECVWNLLESTGNTKETLQELYQGKVGVYAGAMYQHYHYLNTDMIREAAISMSSYSSIANRVSYFFDFKGPSIAVDTACSSSAIAIHMACESLIKGECRIAIAGGVNLSIHPDKYIGLSLAKMLGSNPEIRSFGDGDGFFPSEGVGAVLLKPLKQAVLDGDSVLAVIKSTATNHDGHSNGYTVPSLNAQAELFEENFRKSHIDPRTISYVEAAANGSALGDPIEVTALTKAFQKFTQDKQFCAIGTIKSNIGHAEAASGISQLTKVVLQLKNKKLVPSIKAEPLNPSINFNETPFYLQTAAEEWKQSVANVNGDKTEVPRRAVINSFGASGSNVQIIVEEYLPSQQKNKIHAQSEPQIVIFSAKSQNALKALILKMLQFLEHHNDIDLQNFAYTLQVGRNHMEYRWAAVVSTKGELTQLMSTYLKAESESIPVFLGNSQEDAMGIRSFFSGTLGETMVNALMAEKNVEKLAIYWSQGGKIEWKSLHQNGDAHIIQLPTYPFEKRRCWIEYKPKTVNMYYNGSGVKTMPALNVKDNVTGIVLKLLGLSEDEMDINRAIEQYGFDSIMLMQLLRILQQELNPSISLVDLKQSSTLQDIINMVSQKSIDKSEANIYLQPEKKARFPELIHLNPGSGGLPVFWIHSGIGGVEIYQEIAKKSQRPFYGIQARGWMTERSPLNKLQAMAAYYVHIIQTVQPEGPYDLGGYSLGGSLAYEVTRQLQELGEKVNSIVMLDSLYFTIQGKVPIYPKKVFLQTINMAMQLSNSDNKKLEKILISRDEVDLNASDEEFLEQLVMLAKKRGLVRNEKQFTYLVNQCMKTLKMGQPDDYAGLPLPSPDTVTCYYFRNKSGSFYGNMEKYFTVENEENAFKYENCWDGWKKQIQNFNIIDVDSTNHLSLLHEPKAYKPIEEFCGKLYSQEGISEEYLKQFSKKQSIRTRVSKERVDR